MDIRHNNELLYVLKIRLFHSAFVVKGRMYIDTMIDASAQWHASAGEVMAPCKSFSYSNSAGVQNMWRLPIFRASNLLPLRRTIRKRVDHWTGTNFSILTMALSGKGAKHVIRLFIFDKLTRKRILIFYRTFIEYSFQQYGNKLMRASVLQLIFVVIE